MQNILLDVSLYGVISVFILPKETLVFENALLEYISLFLNFWDSEFWNFNFKTNISIELTLIGNSKYIF